MRYMFFIVLSSGHNPDDQLFKAVSFDAHENLVPAWHQTRNLRKQRSRRLHRKHKNMQAFQEICRIFM